MGLSRYMSGWERHGDPEGKGLSKDMNRLSLVFVHECELQGTQIAGMIVRLKSRQRALHVT